MRPKSFLSGILIFAGAFSLSVSLFSQIIPLEEKGKYERSLERKVDEVLLRILGPNQGKTFIQATIDFSRIEKIETVKDSKSKEENSFFKWLNISTQTQTSDQLLPGFENPFSEETKGYQKYMQFPLSAIKKLDVTVVLNEGIDKVAAENVRLVVSDLLSLNVERGDKLSIVRAPFAPIWKTVWYTPETMSLIFKYIALTLMGIIAIIVMAIGFLKLASAMSSMAKTQTHEISMDFGKGGVIGGAGSQGDLLGVPLPAIEKKKEEEKAGEEEEEKPVVFNVRLDQVPFLADMMLDEDPANVAILAAHLEPEVRSELFKQLPPKFVSEIVANMAEVRFVEMDIILALKEELENRLRGAVGGVGKVLETIDKMDMGSKRRALEELEKNHPELFSQVKKHVFLIEDIASLNEKDMSILVNSVGIEDWAAALWDMQPELKNKIKAQMLERTWQMVEQTMSYGTVPREKIEKAIENIIAVAIGLMRDGKIDNPLEKSTTLIETNLEDGKVNSVGDKDDTQVST